MYPYTAPAQLCHIQIGFKYFSYPANSLAENETQWQTERSRWGVQLKQQGSKLCQDSGSSRNDTEILMHISWCTSWNGPWVLLLSPACLLTTQRRSGHEGRTGSVWAGQPEGLQDLPWVGTAPALTAQFQIPHSRSTRLAQKIRPDVIALSTRSRESSPSLPWLRTSTVSGRHHTRILILNKTRFCCSGSKRSRDFQISCSWQYPLD